MNTFSLKVIACDKVFFDGRCVQVVLPLHDGLNGNTILGVTGTGFAQMINNRATVIVDTCEYPEEIDLRRAQEAKERAEEQLRQKQSIEEYHRSKASLARAMARLKAGNKDIPLGY